MDWSTLKNQFETDGVVVIRGFLDPVALAELTGNLDRYIREVVPRLPDGDAFYDDRSRPETLKQLNRIQQDPFFAQYLKHPLWTRAAESLLGEPVRVQGAEWFNKPPNTQHPTPPHQDNYYFCLTPPQVLTMWLALDPVDEENGCLRYIKKSHQRPIRPHHRTKTLGFSQGIADYGDRDREEEVPVPASPGDVLIHHGNTIHRADPNRSMNHHRRSFGMVFQGVSAVRDENAFRRYTESSKAQHLEMGLTT
jgi:phytanoyl-CoA hydroxylase